jgi:hypothetical protein
MYIFIAAVGESCRYNPATGVFLYQAITWNSNAICGGGLFKFSVICDEK